MMQLLSRMAPLLNKLVPAKLAANGLSKLHPKLGTFIQTAAAAGYGTDEILDFLRNRMEPSGSTFERQRLNQGAQQGTLRPDEMSSLQKMNDQGGSLAHIGVGLGIGALSVMERGNKNQAAQNQSIMPDEITTQDQQEQQRALPYKAKNQLTYDPYDKRQAIPPDNQALITEPPPEGKYPPPKPKPNYTPDFLKYLRPLITNGTIDKEDSSTIDNFWRYWQATEGEKRSSPFVEFEKFRVNTKDWLNIPNRGQQQQQQSSGPGQQALLDILNKLQQMRGK